MVWIFDIVLILLYFLTIIICACRGFVKSIWSAVTIIGALVLAYMGGPVLSGWFYDTFIYDRVISYSYDTVDSIVKETSDEYVDGDIFDTLSDKLEDWFELSGGNFEEIKAEYSQSLSDSADKLPEMLETIAKTVSKNVSDILAFLTIFLVALVLISLVGCFLKLVVKIPIIRSINALLGALLGAVEGLIIVWLVCFVINVLVKIELLSGESNEFLYLITQSSRIFDFYLIFLP